VPAAWYLRETANRGWARELRTVSKKVFWRVGFTVLSVEKERPSRPSVSWSEENWAETEVAASTAWLVAVTPATTTLSA
jgi:hypothetical protein